MLKLGAPYTKDEIAAAFAAEHTAVHQFFQQIPQDDFFTAPADVWTPADNLFHLTASSNPIVLALRLPKFLIRLRFGKAKHASRSLATVRQEYTGVALAGGGVASGPYVPNITEHSAAKKERILAKWLETGHKIENAVPKWSEKDLDALAVPHPLLGDMTIREILFFTLYHNLHHVRDVQQLLGQPLDEWFEPVHK
ncbi:MAG: DinB family protein [Chloroflexota bacterium]